MVIVGAGPCGLACARELILLGHRDVLVLESAAIPGGLASSVVDKAGFTWDRGGHVVFSHYGEFDRLLDDVMSGDVHHHDRSSFVRIADRWVPYPFQNNLHHLPPDLADEALIGLVEAQLAIQSDDGSSDAALLDFGTWMEGMFGSGIVRQFMRPYNEKVWAQPASAMSAQWMAERVATVDWRQALRGLVHRSDDVAWGPNNRFAFPIAGGTGEIYRRLAANLGCRITYHATVSTVDAEQRALCTVDGRRFEYEHLLWTAPLDRLVGALTSAPEELRAASADLIHNSVTVVGIGYEAPLTDERSWLYFPEPDVPFYRATNFAKYAAANVPDADTDRYCSWMTEIASSEWRPLPGGEVGDGHPDEASDAALAVRVDSAIRSAGLVAPDATVASAHVEHLPYGYPVPTLGRDRALRTIQPWLMERGILARGRFGGWKYELGNMDHAVKMGIDAARRMALGEDEQAWSL